MPGTAGRRAHSLLLALAAGLGVASACSRDPLVAAALEGDRVRAERLLARGLDPNAVETLTQPGHSGASFRVTPLVAAAGRGDVALIELLVARGADPHWNDGNFTAFEWAIRFGHGGAARRLGALSDGETYAARAAASLPLALRVGDRETLAFILERVGAESCRAADALPPLARGGVPSDAELVSALLDRGVRPTPEAAQAAAERERRDILERLLERAEARGWLAGCGGPAPGVQRAAGPLLRGALVASVLGLRLEMVRLLLERGADPNAPDAEGRTAVMLLAQHIYLQKVYAAPPYAEAPLPVPSEYHRLWFAPLFELLVGAGADLGLRDRAGRSVLDYLNPADDHDYALKRRLLEERMAAAAPRP
jgi:ankyrin repeat protein